MFASRLCWSSPGTCDVSALPEQPHLFLFSSTVEMLVLTRVLLVLAASPGLPMCFNMNNSLARSTSIVKLKLQLACSSNAESGTRLSRVSDPAFSHHPIRLWLSHFINTG